MHRWATFFLLLLWLLAHPHPLVASASFLPNKPLHPASVGTLASADAARPNCAARTAGSKDCRNSSYWGSLAELVQAADLIVRGHVAASHSFWDADHRLIESEVTIEVAYELLGNPVHTIKLQTTGGFLTAEGIGMVSMHEANWMVGEEILAFAYRQDGVWRTVGGATGKFVVQQNMVLNQDLALSQPLDGLLPTIVDLIKQHGRQAQVPTVWRYLEATTASTLAAPITAVTAQNDNRKWATPHATAAFTINLNTEQVDGQNGSRADFRQAISAAAASWSQVANVDFVLTYAGATNATQTGYNGVNEVLFMHKGQQERAAAAQVWFTADGTIIEADIWINDDYTWNATGDPAADEVDLQSALLHEFGHWLILGHCADSHAVMFAKLKAGTLKRELQPSDMLGIRAIYPQ